MYFTYILKSKRNGQYYVGYTNDVNTRLKLHNAGKVSATKRFIPWEVFYSEQFQTEREAINRERQIKSWKSRKAIERLKFIQNRGSATFGRDNIEIAAYAEENKQKEQLNCIVIHGCPSDAERAMDPERRTYDKHWIPWLKKNLTALGIKTEAPLMPNPWAPDYEAFKQDFEKLEVSENTILIGHSCGCAFLVRWLGESKHKIKKLILVAPWKIADEDDQFRPAFYNYPIDETIKDRVGEIVMFTADDEEEAGKESLQIFHKILGGRIIELKGRGHYTLGDMDTEEFPELLEVAVGNG